MSVHLFEPLTQRAVTFRNRIAVSPMCQYSSHDGFANDWHFAHLGSRAIGGAALVMMEATAVEARGRISAFDQGIWKDEHIQFLSRIAAFVKQFGAVPGVQLAHAGRKASVARPWEGGAALTPSEGAWQTVAPSALPFRPEDPTPAELSISEIHAITQAFVDAALRAHRAGFELVEVHGAHGYLMHQFLSPLSNHRTDQYGGSFENRIRFALETIAAVRAVWPAELPLWLRISASDWADGGWTIADSVELARRVKPLGVDLLDCSSGGASIHQKIPVAPGYQVPFAQRIRAEAGIATGAVGLITTPQQADQIIRDGHADMVLLAREFLRDPYFPLHAAHVLGAKLDPPAQYLRAF
ncbi:MAG TPA: NADH:flavin oxidoreductase/NADH oxidase [Bryobacteraceae bacterium]|jgi:2,4-dienoyl-CoA reductase-like NADH-dependent reductase (Old Yellow Enzyme family)|nr:NADH:flavin oxidoreductase/NADH oxidase [Bryobacteraceae bacterium]